MLAGLTKEQSPWNSSSRGVTKLETHSSNRAMNGPPKQSSRLDHGWTCQCATVKVMADPHRMHTLVSEVWRAFSLSAASPLRQTPKLVCNDCTFKALGDRRQNTETPGAILWAPALREKDACLEATMQRREWEGSVATRWPDACGLTASAAEETGALADTQELVQAPPPPRVEAAPGSLSQAPPSGVLLTKSPNKTVKSSDLYVIPAISAPGKTR